MQFNVLVIEDDERDIADHRAALEKLLKDASYKGISVELVCVATLSDAKRRLRGAFCYDAIVFDACMGGDRLNTIPLVSLASSRRAGLPAERKVLLLAAPRSPAFGQRMTNAGCDEWERKERAVLLVMNWLLERRSK